MPAYDVYLGQIYVGRLAQDQAGMSTFRLGKEYRELAMRPVLGQWFEDDLERIYRGSKGRLPAFFDNLIPEGVLRDLLVSTFGLEQGDELGILATTGKDLPGAVELSLADSGVQMAPSHMVAVDEEREDRASDQNGLKFSLAGVQLKFSMLRSGERLTLPAHGEHGLWIVKVDSSKFPGLVRNEFATMSWARSVGFEVPDCFVTSVEVLPEQLGKIVGTISEVLAIKRYDRESSRKVHQEDFAQIAGKYSAHKYDLSYESLASLVLGVLGENGYFEFIRRLVFAVVTGNGDAHLKNWAVLYSDPIVPVFAPMYDQVSTIMWPTVSDELGAC